MRLGWRLTPEGPAAPALSFDLTATRRETGADAPEHGLGVAWGTTGKSALNWRVTAARRTRGGAGPETVIGVRVGLRWRLAGGYRRDPVPGAHRADCGHSGSAGMPVFRGLRAAAAPQALDSIEFPLNPGKSRKIPEKNADSRERSSRETSPSTPQSAANRRPNECLRETRGPLRGAGPGSACPGAGRGSPGRGTGDAGQKSPMALFDVQTTGAGAGMVSGRWR